MGAGLSDGTRLGLALTEGIDAGRLEDLMLGSLEVDGTDEGRPLRAALG